jgi:hypothetical protein
LDDIESLYQLKVADVGSSHAVSQFEGARPDEEIRKRNSHAFGWALAVDLTGAQSDRDCYWLDGYSGEQLVKKTLPALSALRCVGASDAVGEFQDGDNGKSDSFVASFQRYRLQELAGVLTLPFGGNRCRRIEH